MCAPAGAEGRFFKEKAPQKPFWEKVFGVPHGVGANMAVPVPEGARPVFAGGKDRQRCSLLFRAHLSLGGIVLWMLVGWCFFGFKLEFIGVLRQIPSESVGAIHESPASKLGFIGV